MQLKIYPSFPDELIDEILSEKSNYIIEPFLDPIWVNNWWKNIGKNEYNEIKYLNFINDENYKLIVPLVTREIFGLKIIEIAGGKVSDYLSPIFHKKLKLSRMDLIFIKEEIFKNFKNIDLIFFRKQKQYESTQNPILLLDKPIMGLHKSYSIKFDSFIQNKKIKKIYNDNKRQLKRLNTMGEVSFVEAKDDNQKISILENMIFQKEDRYKKTNVWNMFGISYYKNFYYDLIRSNFNFLKIHISAVKVGNNFISTHLGFFDNETYYYLMPSFDNVNYKSYSGGNILLENLIKFAESKNINVFDFTIGNESYKQKWTNETNELFDVVLSNSIYGKFSKLLIQLIFFLKRIKLIDKIYKKIYKFIH